MKSAAILITINITNPIAENGTPFAINDLNTIYLLQIHISHIKPHNSATTVPALSLIHI